ncbi:hypothetical protein [Haloferax sp. YSMS24]|uniref:hypothetical protein n=1 Tax=Haloferax sp. YSMS24 TaxID=3388425 RepID=UPI00398CB562
MESLDIQNVKLIRFDSKLNSSEGSFEAHLQNIYDSKSDEIQHNPQFNGTQIEATYRYYSDLSENAPNELKEFSDICTYSVGESEDGLFSDIITVAVVDREVVTDVMDGLGGEARLKRIEWRDNLAVLDDQLPTMVDSDEFSTTITYIELGTSVELHKGGSIDKERVDRVLRANSNRLSKFGFELSENLSMLSGAYLLPTADSDSTWSPLTLVNTNTQVTTPKSKHHPSPWEWIKFEYTRLRAISQFFKAEQWFEFRRNSLENVDEQTHDLKSYLNISEQDSYDDARDVGEDVEKLQKEWTIVYSQSVDELRAIKDFKSHTSIVGQKTNLEEFIERESIEDAPDKSRLYQYYSQNKSHLSRLDDDINRVGKKLDRLSNLVRDLEQSRATDSNISLQKSVRRLTYILLFLGIADFIAVWSKPVSLILFSLALLMSYLMISTDIMLVNTAIFGEQTEDDNHNENQE